MMKTNPALTKTHPGNIIITVIAILAVIGGIYYLINYLLYSRNYIETNDAQVESYINPISARTGGYIEKVWFNEYELVEAGDTLVTLDNRENNARLMEAQAAVDDANAQLVSLQAGIAASTTATRVNQDQIGGAKARFVQQQLDMKRYQNLVKEEAATGSDLEQVR
ncbi:MAG: HlyD family secretion protein, partial [Pedobacter sp.]|nr:HlyD family secretion protein [Pedobacter sp.]